MNSSGFRFLLLGMTACRRYTRRGVSSGSSSSSEDMTVGGVPWCTVAARGRGKASSLSSDSPEQCGHDSFFHATFFPRNYVAGIAWMGITDGVSAWTDVGVDPGRISRQLMKNASSIITAKNFRAKHTSPSLLLGEAYWKLLYGKEVDLGSTTACVAKISPYIKDTEKLTDKDLMSEQKPDLVVGWLLEVANLGDSGLAIFRRQRSELVTVNPQPAEWKHVWTTPFSRMYGAPLQLALLTPEMLKQGYIQTDPGESSIYHAMLTEGDIVIMATDGVWDNIQPAELTAVVNKCASEVLLRASLLHTGSGSGSSASDPTTAQAFLRQLCEAVITKSLAGPKPDDITVVALGINSLI